MNNDKYTTKEEIALMRIEIEEAKSNMHNKKLKIIRFIKLFMFLAVFLLLTSTLVSVLLTRYSGATPSIFGYQLYTVQSGSMSPTLPIGSIILSKKTDDAAALKAGDIVTFSLNGAVVTHRIIEVINDNGIKYRTKGDNPDNTADIELLSPDNVKAIFVMKLY
ncbi:signal peptidase [Ruminiclostridium sufflavum DSM 19573]|uniref:Signal peptidase I n=1 Tax=Ruminiclostridium sufflavum DSM 19573 TaxID=1121337 RepID=A0A318XKM3_9FIRM|nr:signal peptidase I [Ruminiclostridium sufflavum]PYG87096.1 signal peptidase [Ruminiclostridium sufflavum DSM 19573]